MENMKSCISLGSAYRAALIVCLLGTATTLLVAQSRTTSLTGLISDTQSLPLSGANVLVSNQATGVTIKSQTDAAGMYQVENLTPGSYRLEVSSPGFSTAVRTGLLLETGQTGRLDVALKVGDIKETVTVSAAAPLLQTEGAELVGQTVMRRELEYAPNSDRKFPSLLALSALTQSTGEQAFGHAYPTLAGTGGSNTGFYLNGGQTVDVASVSPVYSFSTEFVDEFKVVANNASAQYEGDKTIQLTTKSGTNKFHGGGNFFIQDAALNAVSWGSKTKLPFREDEWGVQLGGPLRKNKTFFFAGIQRATFTQTLPAFLTMPTALQKNGDFSQTFDGSGNLIKIYDPVTTRPDPSNPAVLIRDQFPGNVIPSNRVDPVAAQIISFFPDPNHQGTIAGGNNYQANRKTTHVTPMYAFRLDQQWSNNDRTFASFNNNDFLASYPSVFGVVGFNDADNQANTEHFKMYQVTITNTYSPNARWMLDTSFALQGFWQQYVDAGYNKGFPAKLGLTGVPTYSNFPELSLASYTSVGGSIFGNLRQHPYLNYSISQDVTTIRGKHTLKFGFTFEKGYQPFLFSLFLSTLNFGVQPTALPNVAGTGNSVAALLLGFPMSASTENQYDKIRKDTVYETYVQDDWKILPNLTLNMGLRWETLHPPFSTTDAAGHPFMSGFDPKCINPVSNTPGCVTYAGKDFPVLPRQSFKYFAPRVGVSWVPWGTKTVIRAGGGIYYLPFENGNSVQLAYNAVAAGNFSSPDNGITPAFLLKDGYPPIPTQPENHGFGAVPVGQSPRFSVSYQGPYGFHRPYAIEYNFTIQRQLTTTSVLQASYLAYLGRHIMSSLQNNQLPPSEFGPGNAQVLRSFPQYGNVTNVSATVFSSSYNALFVKAEKRYSNGLNFDVQYVFNKNLSNNNPWNSYDVKAGNAFIQPQHRLVGNAVYDLPWGPGRQWLKTGVLSKIVGGWVVSPVLTLQSGSYLDVTYITDTTNGFLQGNQGVNRQGNPNLPNGQRTMAKWFNTGVFSAPAPFTLGNAGRTNVKGPGFIGYDMGITRVDRIKERFSARWGVQLFNAFNHPVLNNPDTTFGSSTFGVISSKSGNRSVQLFARLIF
jgi:hypothetical protein